MQAPSHALTIFIICWLVRLCSSKLFFLAVFYHEFRERCGHAYFPPTSLQNCWIRDYFFICVHFSPSLLIVFNFVYFAEQFKNPKSWFAESNVSLSPTMRSTMLTKLLRITCVTKVQWNCFIILWFVWSCNLLFPCFVHFAFSFLYFICLLLCVQCWFPSWKIFFFSIKPFDVQSGLTQLCLCRVVNLANW